MADYPEKGLPDWGDELKAYVDTEDDASLAAANEADDTADAAAATAATALAAANEADDTADAASAAAATALAAANEADDTADVAAAAAATALAAGNEADDTADAAAAAAAAALAAALAAAPAYARPKMFSGTWVAPSGLPTPNTVGQGNIYLMPLNMLVGMVVDQVGFEAVTGVALSFVRIGLYKRTAVRTYTRVAAFGTVDTSTAGLKAIAAAFTVEADHYIAYQIEGANVILQHIESPGAPFAMATATPLGTSKSGGAVAAAAAVQGSLAASVTANADDSGRAFRYYLRSA